MKRIFMFFGILISTLLLISCNSETNDNPFSEVTISETGNPTPEEILSNDPNADIFLIGDVVYINAEDIRWVKELELTIGDKSGEIKKNTTNSSEFESYTANKLPIGTVIYSPVEKSGPIKIVIIDNKEIRYLGMIEG
ncbi:hypothetical protein UACE39S_05479 [Ureibacillus acetophenoni]